MGWGPVGTGIREDTRASRLPDHPQVSPGYRNGYKDECPSCETRLLGEQRCPDCHLWARRIGPGGVCPHCDELVAFAELVPELLPHGSPQV